MKKPVLKTVQLLFLALIFAQYSYGQTLQDTIAFIDNTISQYEATNPGCQISIERNGKIIYSKAVGMADLERNVPLTINTVIEGGSLSKQITAAAILLLQQQGKLSLEDDIRKYVPEIPNYGATIKLSHLLHHTSGLRDWGSVAELTGWGRGSVFYTNEDALEIISRQKQLNNKPGDEYIYSNSGYNLFAIIVQRISGLTLAEFSNKYIFEPAGMTHTQWRDNPNRIVLNRAIAYAKTSNGYEIDMPNEYVYGNGGLLTTTEDLLKWSDFYQKGKLGSSSLLAKQLHTEPLNDGKLNPYGAGLFIGKIRGWDNINHSGATAGYRAYLETYPELNYTIAILSNTPQFNVINIATQISKLFTPEKIISNIDVATLQKKPIVTPVPYKPADLKIYTGSYFSEETNSTISITLKDNSLTIRLSPNKIVLLQPKTKDIFDVKNFSGVLEFNRNANGEINSFKISIARARNVVFDKKN